MFRKSQIVSTASGSKQAVNSFKDLGNSMLTAKAFFITDDFDYFSYSTLTNYIYMQEIVNFSPEGDKIIHNSEKLSNIKRYSYHLFALTSFSHF